MISPRLGRIHQQALENPDPSVSEVTLEEFLSGTGQVSYTVYMYINIEACQFAVTKNGFSSSGTAKFVKPEDAFTYQGKPYCLLEGRLERDNNEWFGLPYDTVGKTWNGHEGQVWEYKYEDESHHVLVTLTRGMKGGEKHA